MLCVMKLSVSIYKGLLITIFIFLISMVTSLIILCFCTFSLILPDIEFFISLTKSFSKSIFAFSLSFVFNSVCGLDHSFRLNSFLFEFFCYFIPLFKPCCKFVNNTIFLVIQILLRFSTLRSFDFFKKKKELVMWQPELFKILYVNFQKLTNLTSSKVFEEILGKFCCFI